MRWLVVWLFLAGTLLADDGAMERYLEPFPSDLKASTIAKIVVEPEKVRVWGLGSGEPGDVLFEWPAENDYVDGFDADGAEVKIAAVLPQGERGNTTGLQFAIEVPRFVGEGEQRVDRAMTRWGVGRLVDSSQQPQPGEMARVLFESEARWADRISSRETTPHPELGSRKGLGAIGLDRPLEDLETLGVSAVTFNILVDTVIRTEPGEGRTPFDAFGRRWYADEGALAGLDRTLQEAAQRKLLVSAILLLRQANQCADREWGKMAAHPDAAPEGIFVMPNLTDASGVAAYGAALELLAERYSRPDGPSGESVPRIHHWILHNEVNSGWVWTNAGKRSALSYVDLLHRSARLTHCIVRRYDRQSQVFVSLDHHWTTRHNEHCFGAREILERFLQFSLTEGNFDWAIAHHPYPQDLFEPRVWRDDQVTFDFDTPKITFRNLEVLDAWVKRPDALFDGKPRKIHLTEQGLNSRTYGEQDLVDQAAGMAYAWKRMESLPTIELFHYHNWVDNRHEGGLRIGLRRFPDDAEQPGGAKPIWEVFRRIGTAEEAEAVAFAIERIGREAWENARVRGRE